MDDRLREAGLGDYVDFIHSKVFIDVGHGYMHHDDHAIDLFIGRLLKHPDYADKVRAMVQPAFAEIMRAIGGKKGVVLERSEIETLLQTAVAAGIAGEKRITVWLQNWTNHHALAVDIADLQVCYLSTPQTGSVERHEQSAMEGSAGGIDESCDFFLAEDRWKVMVLGSRRRSRLS